MDFVAGARTYLERLQQDRQLHTYRITRCKLGFRPPQLREFHITLEFEHMTQMQAAFDPFLPHGPGREPHHAVN
jgi:hypothetical protein